MSHPSASSYFSENRYVIRRKVFKFLGGAFHIYDESGQVVAYSKLAAFRLREDVRLYTGEDMAQEILRIGARQILDIGATYDVVDSATGTPVGALRRRGLKSIVRDEWAILDAEGREIGKIVEDSMIMALFRRFITALIPQTFECEVNGATACRFHQNFNPFVLKVNVTFEPASDGYRPLLMAAGLLLCAIEGRQD